MILFVWLQDLFERQAVYTCTYCGAVFPHQSKLTRHILSHSLGTLKYREQSQSQSSALPAPPPPYGSPFAPVHHASAIACAAAAVVCAVPGTLSPAGAIIGSAAHESASSVGVSVACGNGAGGASCVGPLAEWSPLRAPLVELPQPLDAQQSAIEAAAAAETPGAVCKFCGKAFPDVGALIGHLPAHTGDRPFKCEFCGKAFKLRHHMKDHCRVHTGERPFRCSLCGKTFSRSTILKAHEKTHYPKYVRKFLSSPSPEEEHRPPDIPLPCDLSMGENNVEASTSTPPMYMHRPTPSPSP
ncbi:hypothetical protein V9T40_009217 [Parthenolecanium corni]|uniref:C2H2-type domain-containing protein n=1 Tax=Parthenolecanium corni TaxID=536013 RepID=A0AAN9Y7B2_9HEMI